jgi:hypothetical protein
VLFWSAGIAFGSWGWWWNAQLDIEGVEVHTAWTVVGGGDADDYRAGIQVRVPHGTDASIVDQANNEVVLLKSRGGLECDDDGLEAQVAFQVHSQPGVPAGGTVEVEVTADGDVIGSGSGRLGERIELDVFIAASNPSCAD